MKHKGTVWLETPRLILRRYVIDDFEPMYRNCWSEYDVWKWTNYVPMDCLDDVKTKANMFTEKWLSYDNPRRYSWAMELKSTGDVIGRMFGMHPDDEL
ncbi:MAG: GNAT family N-acetyltransferase, partial [Clostridia bacterium]|nr:GNAT family N-acetyltransferase [Clostridia bacterium]